MLAGGQSLVQLMKFRTAKPSALVDVNGVAGLDVLEERDGELHVGATVRQQRLLDDPLVAEGWPLLREAARFVGYLETRRRGTVCGSLAFAAPWAELTAAAVALDAAIDVRSARGERTIAARDFFLGPHKTVLEPDELIVKARFPRPAAGTGAGFHEISVRHRDYAQLAAGRARHRRRPGRARPAPCRRHALPRRRHGGAGRRRRPPRAAGRHRPARRTSRRRRRTGAASPRSSRAGRSTTPEARA